MIWMNSHDENIMVTDPAYYCGSIMGIPFWDSAGPDFFSRGRGPVIKLCFPGVECRGGAGVGACRNKLHFKKDIFYQI